MFKELDNKSKIAIMKKYANTNKGKELAPALDRLVIEAIILFACTPIIIVAIFVADWPLWSLGVAGITLIFGLVFFIGQNNIRNKEYNKFLSQLPKSEKNKLTKRK